MSSFNLHSVDVTYIDISNALNFILLCVLYSFDFDDLDFWSFIRTITSSRCDSCRPFWCTKCYLSSSIESEDMTNDACCTNLISVTLTFDLWWYQSSSSFLVTHILHNEVSWRCITNWQCYPMSTHRGRTNRQTDNPNTGTFTLTYPMLCHGGPKFKYD